MPYNFSIYPVGGKQYCLSSSSSSTSMGSSISRAKHDIQSLPRSIRRVLSAPIGRQSRFANWVLLKNFDAFYWIKLVIMLKLRSSSSDKGVAFLRLGPGFELIIKKSFVTVTYCSCLLYCVIIINAAGTILWLRRMHMLQSMHKMSLDSFLVGCIDYNWIIK